eukprot:12652218-Ditylum_brightwellii.AAC.1
MHGIDIDNISRETANEYVIVKYNCKELQELGDDSLEYEELSTKKLMGGIGIVGTEIQEDQFMNGRGEIPFT